MDSKTFNISVPNFDKENLLKDYESFHKELYNIVKNHQIDKKYTVIQIMLPPIVRSERHRIHTFTNWKTEIYSIDKPIDDHRKMIIEFGINYLNELIQKYKPVVVEPVVIEPVVQVFDPKEFKNKLIEDIKFLIDSRIEELIKNLKV